MTGIPRVSYGTSEIEYSVKRSDQRTTADVAVDPKEGVIVTCPPDIPEREIEKIVLKKATWIFKKMKRMGEVEAEPPKREYVSGESYLYLGRRYRLKVIEDPTLESFKVKLKEGRFLVHVRPFTEGQPREAVVPDALQWWFRRKAERRLTERVSKYAPKIGVESKGIVVKNQMKRWGSCTKEGVLHLNYRVIMAPMSIVDYIVVHELVHLKHPEHSDKFWKQIRTMLPDYERRKEWLRIHGPELTI